MNTKEWVLAFLEKSYEELIELGFSPAATKLDDLLARGGETFKERLDKNLGVRFDVTLLTEISREGTKLWTIGVKTERGGIIRTMGFGGIKIREEVFVFFVANASIHCDPVPSNDWVAENAVSIPVKKLYEMKVPEVCEKIQQVLKSLWEKLSTVGVEDNQEEN